MQNVMSTFYRVMDVLNLDETYVLVHGAVAAC